MRFRAKVIGMIFCAAAGIFSGAEAGPFHDEGVQSRHFASPVSALKDVIRARGLEFFSARANYTEKEWLTAEGDDGISPADLALSTADQWRYVPKKILFSSAMASRRWEKAGGEPLMLRALEEDHGENFMVRDDFADAGNFWRHDIDGAPFACRLIESHMLKKVDPELFQATPHGIWKDVSCAGAGAIDLIAKDTGLVNKFFAAQNWIGRTAEMKETFDWIAQAMNGNGTGKVSAYVRQSFERSYKEAGILTKDRKERMRRVQIRASVDIPQTYPPG